MITLRPNGMDLYTGSMTLTCFSISFRRKGTHFWKIWFSRDTAALEAGREFSS